MGKESACNAGDPGNVGSILALGRSPGGGNGNPCLGNPMDRGAGQDTVRGVAKRQTQLSNFHFHLIGLSNQPCTQLCIKYKYYNL